MVPGSCIVVVLQGLRKYFIGLESWLVRTWGICYASSASEGLLLGFEAIFYVSCIFKLYANS